jgi:hypothetical protein
MEEGEEVVVVVLGWGFSKRGEKSVESAGGGVSCWWKAGTTKRRPKTTTTRPI